MKQRIAAIALLTLFGAWSAQAQDDHGSAPELLNASALGNSEGGEHEAFQIFDNLYYVGINFVSAYVVTTSEGLVLIDATYDNTVDHLLAGMATFNLDPADITYILVTHWHADHFGGAERIQKISGAIVGMIGNDWESKFLEHSLPADTVWRIGDGDTLTVGDTAFEFLHTPGHTLGVLSLSFPVYDNGQQHKAFTFGGTGLNFSGVEQSEMYLDSVRRIQALEGIEVNVANHESMGRVFERHESLKKRQPGDPHPFVDPEGFREWLRQLETAGAKKLERERDKQARRER